jgi:hypothetical protein
MNAHFRRAWIQRCRAILHGGYAMPPKRCRLRCSATWRASKRRNRALRVRQMPDAQGVGVKL